MISTDLLRSITAPFKAPRTKECQVEVVYTGLLRNATRTGGEEVRLPHGSTPLDLLHYLVAKYGQPFERQLWDKKGELQSTVRVFVDEVEWPYQRLAEEPLSGGRVILMVLLEQMSGGADPFIGGKNG